MGLFKAEPHTAAPVDTEPNFSEFTETFAKKPVRITCDTNFINTLPNRTLPYCVKIQMEVHADPDNPKLIADSELAHAANLRSIIGQHIRGRYVGQGIVASQSVIFQIFYIPEKMAAASKNMLNETLSSTFRRMDFTMDYDPEGKQYLEYLFPTELQKKQIENRKILRTLNGYGDNGTAARRVCFHLVFPNRKAALEFYSAVSEKGFVYDSLVEGPAPEGMVLPRYHLTLSREFPFDIELLDLVDGYLLDACEKFDGEYQSLETDIV